MTWQMENKCYYENIAQEDCLEFQNCYFFTSKWKCWIGYTLLWHFCCNNPIQAIYFIHSDDLFLLITTSWQKHLQSLECSLKNLTGKNKNKFSSCSLPPLIKTLFTLLVCFASRWILALFNQILNWTLLLCRPSLLILKMHKFFNHFTNL